MFGAMLSFGDWDISRIRNEKTVEISGELDSKDGAVKYIPKRMKIDYQGISIIIKYKIDEEIKDRG